MYFFQNMENIILFQVIPEKLLVGREGTVGKIRAVRVEIGAEFFIDGITHKSTRAQYQYLLFVQTRSAVFIKGQFYNGCRYFIDPDFDVDSGTQFGMLSRYITQSDPL